MKESKIVIIASYDIDGKKEFQHLPTSTIDDVIYVNGMKKVDARAYIPDVEYYIELDDKIEPVVVGEEVSAQDLVKRYELGDDSIRKELEPADIDYLIEVPTVMFTIYEDKTIGLSSHRRHIKKNKGQISNKCELNNVIKGRTHWYIELHHHDGSISYERTLYNDKMYRGQSCQYYQFVRVCEYMINNKEKKVIVERQIEQFLYHPVEQTYLDGLIDSAKKIIFNGGKNFDDFAGVNQLYAFNTENSASVFFAEEDKIKNAVVTTITGSGDANLDLFLRGANKIISFDVNLIAKFYAELKFIAAKNLSFDEFRKFFLTMDETIFRKIECFLSRDTRKFWQELYSYVKIIDARIKGGESGGLFYPTNYVFSANETSGNSMGYYNAKNYPKLQELLKNKSLDDITFVTCDLLDISTSVNLEESTYVYLSNVMDFMIGIDKNAIDKEAQKRFKYFILNILLPSLKTDAHIVVAYLRTSWQTIEISKYEDLFPACEGFKIKKLPNGRDFIIEYDPENLLIQQFSKPRL